MRRAAASLAGSCLRGQLGRAELFSATSSAGSNATKTARETAATAAIASSTATTATCPTSSSLLSPLAKPFATDARRLRAAKSRAARTPAPATTSEASSPPPLRRSRADDVDGVSVASPSLAAAVSHPALIVTRGIEWGNVVLGFEQANKYTVLDQDGETVALLAEETQSVGSAVARQLLRARRSFVASLLSPDGAEVLARVRRPLYLINSTTTIEDGDGTVVGEVVQRWHPLRRKYDLFVEKVQVAEIDAPLLAWEFTLTDADGRPVALIDRNFSGFGKELFTDAGRYAVHFGESSKREAAEAVRRTIEAAHPEAKPSAVEASVQKALVEAGPSSSTSLVATSTGGALALRGPLKVDERLACLAAAIAIDFDYFSRHSGSGGVGMFPMMLPFPTPSVPAPSEPGVGGGGDGGAAGAEGGGGGGDGAAAGAGAEQQQPLERDLGGGDEAPSPDPWGSAPDEGDDDGFGGSFGGEADDGGDDAGWSWEGDDDGGDDGGGGGGLFGLAKDLLGWEE